MPIITNTKELLVTNNDFIQKLCRYIIVRGIGVFLYAGILIFFIEVISFSAVVASFISFIITSMVLYISNYLWVFKYKKKHTKAFPKFIITEIITLILNTFIMYLVIEILLFNYYYGIIATALIIPLTNLLLNFLWSFKE